MPGENIDRYNRLARRAGFRNYREYLNATKQWNRRFRGYRYWLRRAAENRSAETGEDVREALKEEHKLDSEFHRQYSKVARTGFQEGKPNYEGRAMSEFLEYLGLRDEQDWWGVGDTPNLPW